jgi:hypothetical protein
MYSCERLLESGKLCLKLYQPRGCLPPAWTHEHSNRRICLRLAYENGLENSVTKTTKIRVDFRFWNWLRVSF